MFTLLWKWLVSIFTADKIGVIVRKLLLAAGKPVAKDLFNTQNQKKALEFVKELQKRDDLTGSQKAKEFNKMFLKFLKAGAKEIHSSVLNCIREMALMAAKTEEEEKEAK